MIAPFDTLIILGNITLYSLRVQKVYADLPYTGWISVAVFNGAFYELVTAGCVFYKNIVR